MAIRCQRIGQPQLGHHHETAAIGEGIRVVGMFSEECLGLVEAQRPDPFDTNSGAALKQIENSQSDRGGPLGSVLRVAPPGLAGSDNTTGRILERDRGPRSGPIGGLLGPRLGVRSTMSSEGS